MVVTVVVFNFTLAIVLLYIAWQVQQLQFHLRRIADTLTLWQRNTAAVLQGTPDAIYTGQQGIKQLRRSNEPLQLQIQQVRQILILLGIGQQVWRRSTWRFPYPLRRRKLY